MGKQKELTKDDWYKEAEILKRKYTRLKRKYERETDKQLFVAFLSPLRLLVLLLVIVLFPNN